MLSLIADIVKYLIWDTHLKNINENIVKKCTVGLFRVPRGQTNFYSKIYFLSKFQK